MMIEYWSGQGSAGGQNVPSTRVRDCLKASDGEPGRAMALYRWQRECAMAMFELLLEFEVVLRAALDFQLSRWNLSQGSGDDWLRNPAMPLDTLVSRPLVGSAESSARRDIEAQGRDVIEPSREEMLGHLPFGFWCALLGRYEKAAPERRMVRQRLWEEALCRAFPGLEGATEASVAEALAVLSRLHWLRNRIAHGGSVLDEDPLEVHREIFRVAALIDPELPEYLECVSRLPEVAARVPRVGEG